MHRFTKEEKEFLTEYVPGHRYREIQQEFIKQFGWDITLGQIKSAVGRYKLNTGFTGHYQKGHVPHNKGHKGEYAKGSEKTWFKAGHQNIRQRPVGSERVNVDGYREIKVKEPRKWMLKHRYIWEQAHGPVPKGHVIIFRDNDKLNCTLDNLMLIRRSDLSVMNQNGLSQYTGDAKDVALTIARLKMQTSKAKKRAREARRG